MEIINLCTNPSLVSHFMAELRDAGKQSDRLRFRTNVRRLGQAMAYELSRRLHYREQATTTPLGTASTSVLDDQLVLATILRAGLMLHDSMLSCFDNAENAFVSAYRRCRPGSDEFDVHVEYIACPDINGKTLVITDPMLATGLTMELVYKALLTHGTPARVHVASIIACDQALDHIATCLPDDTTVWVCDIDHQLNAHNYIVPGLGDAGDLLYGNKL